MPDGSRQLNIGEIAGSIRGFGLSFLPISRQRAEYVPGYGCRPRFCNRSCYGVEPSLILQLFPTIPLLHGNGKTSDSVKKLRVRRCFSQPPITNTHPARGSELHGHLSTGVGQRDASDFAHLSTPALSGH